MEPLRGCVLRDGETRHLRPTAMAVFLLLAARPRKVLTKEEILKSVWSDRFVTEGVLHNAINELRQVLGDDPKKPWAIETIHGTGYRLIAEVVRDIPKTDTFAPRANAKGGNSWRSMRVAVIVVIVAFSLVFLVAVGVILYRSLVHPESERISWSEERGSPEDRDDSDCASFLCRDTASIYALESYEQGVSEAAGGERDKAVLSLGDALAADPAFVHACDLLANLYDREEQKDRALEVLDGCGEAAEGKHLFYFHLLDRRRAQVGEMWRREKAALRELLRFDDDHPDWTHRMGFFLLTHELDCSKSLHWHQKAVDAESSLRNVSYLAEAQLRCGQASTALETLDLVSPEDQQAPIFLFVRGFALERNGQVEAAAGVLRRGLELYPNDPGLRLALGDLKRRSGDPRGALELYQQAYIESRVDSDDEAALCLKGRALLDLGDAAGAKKMAEAALGLSAGSLEVDWLLGVALTELGDLQAATAVAERARGKLDSSESLYQAEWVRHLQGTLALKKGDTAAAVEHFTKALEAHPLERLFFESSRDRALDSLPQNSS